MHAKVKETRHRKEDSKWDDTHTKKVCDQWTCNGQMLTLAWIEQRQAECNTVHMMAYDLLSRQTHADEDSAEPAVMTQYFVLLAMMLPLQRCASMGIMQSCWRVGVGARTTCGLSCAPCFTQVELAHCSNKQSARVYEPYVITCGTNMIAHDPVIIEHEPSYDIWQCMGKQRGLGGAPHSSDSFQVCNYMHIC